MKVRFAVALVLIAPLAFAGTGKITGIVVDESGVPVRHMKVEAFPTGGFGGGWEGGVPRAVSDEHGHFVISVPLGALFWRVYPLQEERYYPALDALFYQTDNNNGEIVELGEDNTATVQLKLGQQAGALKLTVTDASTGAPIHPVTYLLAWAKEPKHHGLTATIVRGNRSILLPANTDVTLTVQASGYQSWTYPGVINVGPGQDLPLYIQLQPATARIR